MLTDCVAYRFMRLEIKKAICDILDGDPNVSMEHILAQLTAQFPDISHPGFEGGTLQIYVGEQVEASRREKSNGSTDGQGVTARGNPTGRGVPCAPVVGGDGGCIIEAASELFELPEDLVRGLMVAKLESMQAAYNGDSDWMGDVSGDRFHHNVLAAVARDLGYNLKLVKASEYATILSGEGSYFVYGTLNFDFRPYHQA